MDKFIYIEKKYIYFSKNFKFMNTSVSYSYPYPSIKETVQGTRNGKKI